MCVDLTPGIEMYTNFSANPDHAREFFIAYQDRILYGTDIGAKALLATPEQGIEVKESRSRIDLVRNFLESNDEYWLEDDGGFLLGKQEKPFKGIHLPETALNKIYYQNFERICNNLPRELNPRAIVAECERLVLMIGAMGSVTPDRPTNPAIAQEVKSYFEAYP